MTEENEVDFGGNLRKLRLRRGLTQEDLASRLSVSQATVWEWEHNVSRPRHERLERLCSIVDCSFEELQQAWWADKSRTVETATD